MHGVWMAIAKLAGPAWYKPSWWRYWYNGMPFEFTYQPGVPGLTAVIAWISGISVPHAFQVVCGIVYCFGPAALFLMAWQLTRRAGWSLIAAGVYSLSSASELLLPDTHFAWIHLRDARRMYISFVWDDFPTNSLGDWFALRFCCWRVRSTTANSAVLCGPVWRLPLRCWPARSARRCWCCLSDACWLPTRRSTGSVTSSPHSCAAWADIWRCARFCRHR